MAGGQLDIMNVKNFPDETVKKIMWVKRMYINWKKYRNDISLGEFVYYDLENIESLNESNLLFALTQFITEIKNIDGSNLTAKTLYDIIICVQFFLENLDFTCRLLSQDVFCKICFTLINLMKKRMAEGVSNSI